MIKRIILEDGKQPSFVGQWTIGDVVNMAQQLQNWALSLQVQPTPQIKIEPEPIDEKKDGE